MTPTTIILCLGIILTCIYFAAPIITDNVIGPDLTDYKQALAEIYIENEAFLVEDTDGACRVITGPTNKVLLFGSPCETRIFLNGYEAALHEVCSDPDLDIHFQDIKPFIVKTRAKIREGEDL